LRLDALLIMFDRGLRNVGIGAVERKAGLRGVRPRDQSHSNAGLFCASVVDLPHLAPQRGKQRGKTGRCFPFFCGSAAPMKAIGNCFYIWLARWPITNPVERCQFEPVQPSTLPDATVKTSQSFKLGSKLLLRMTHAGTHFSAKGHVVNQTEVGIGVEFTEIDPGDRNTRISLVPGREQRSFVRSRGGSVRRHRRSNTEWHGASPVRST
jgi:PilZ domain